MNVILLLCAVGFVVGLVLRSVGLGLERRAHMRLMELEHELRWRDSP